MNFGRMHFFKVVCIKFDIVTYHTFAVGKTVAEPVVVGGHGKHESLYRILTVYHAILTKNFLGMLT